MLPSVDKGIVNAVFPLTALIFTVFPAVSDNTALRYPLPQVPVGRKLFPVPTPYTMVVPLTSNWGQTMLAVDDDVCMINTVIR